MNRRRMNKRGKGRRKPKKKSLESGVVRLRRNPKFPGDVKQKPIQNRLIRYFVATALVSFDLTMESILASILFGNATNTNAYSIFETVRLKRISIYCVPTSGFDVQTNSVSFRWLDQNLPDEEITDRGTLTEPACLKLVPPRNSILNMWFRSNSPTLSTPCCVLSVPEGGIIDIEFEHIITDVSGTAYVLTVQPVGNFMFYTSILTGKLIPDGQVSTAITTI